MRERGEGGPQQVGGAGGGAVQDRGGSEVRHVPLQPGGLPGVGGTDRGGTDPQQDHQPPEFHPIAAAPRYALGIARSCFATQEARWLKQLR